MLSGHFNFVIHHEMFFYIAILAMFFILQFLVIWLQVALSSISLLQLCIMFQFVGNSWFHKLFLDKHKGIWFRPKCGLKQFTYILLKFMTFSVSQGKHIIGWVERSWPWSHSSTHHSINVTIVLCDVIWLFLQQSCDV